VLISNLISKEKNLILVPIKGILGLFQRRGHSLHYSEEGQQMLNLGKSSGLLFILFAICLFGLSAKAKYGGGSGTAEEPYLIYTAEQMNAIGAEPNDWDKHFKLMVDIDLGDYAGTGFNIIGTDHFNRFRGVFDGNSHTVSNFTYSSTGKGYIGLFGGIGYDAKIRNLGLIDPNINAGTGHCVGALVGKLFDGTVTGCYVHGGSVSGDQSVGGLVGWNYAAETTSSGIVLHGSITNCHATCRVFGSGLGTGGLVGDNWGTLSDNYATGGVLGDRWVGGLVGLSSGEVFNCYSASNVKGTTAVGGLIGLSVDRARVTNCYSAGSVSADHWVGGLVGGNKNNSKVSDCYSTSCVFGKSKIGGLAGVNQGTVSNCYSASGVEGITDVGGLIGSLNADSFYPHGNVSDSFWDAEASGQASSAAGIGKTTAEMKQKATFTNWDFTEVWGIAENQTYPFLLRCPASDINGDCKVDFTDLVIMASHWLY